VSINHIGHANVKTMIDQVTTNLAAALGPEWSHLSAREQCDVVDDYDACAWDDGCTEEEYARRVGKGNLSAYARCLGAANRRAYG
jgi:hypothetical protein